MSRFAYVAHCLLNQNSKVDEFAVCAGAYTPLIDALREHGSRCVSCRARSSHSAASPASGTSASSTTPPASGATRGGWPIRSSPRSSTIYAMAARC
jgi:hypothetical protein